MPKHLSVRREYDAWRSAKRRCHDPRTIYYERYGGRGIKMCAEWQASFDSFLLFIGPCPSRNHSLDRIDNDGNYEPGNVRWATLEEQRRNRSDNRRLTFFGQTKTTVEWSIETGLSESVIRARVKRGWPMERVLQEPTFLGRHTQRSLSRFIMERNPDLAGFFETRDRA